MKDTWTAKGLLTDYWKTIVECRIFVELLNASSIASIRPIGLVFPDLAIGQETPRMTKLGAS